MKNDTEVSLEFSSDLKYTQFCVLILGFLKNILKINEDDFFNIEISLREVTNNAILHGNKSNLEKKVYVRFQWDKSLLRIRIKDENDEKVDFDRIHKKIENNDVLSYTGRGILIMKNYMDHVEFLPSENGTEIVMEKRL